MGGYTLSGAGLAGAPRVGKPGSARGRASPPGAGGAGASAGSPRAPPPPPPRPRRYSGLVCQNRS